MKDGRDGWCGKNRGKDSKLQEVGSYSVSDLEAWPLVDGLRCARARRETVG